MLITLTVVTTIFIMILFVSIANDWDELAAVSVTVLIMGGIIGWGLIGSFTEVKIIGKVIPKDKYEILIGEDKIVITNLYSKVTNTFEDARTYNIIANKKDKYYLELTEYNMYDCEIKTTIVVKDIRFIKK